MALRPDLPAPIHRRGLALALLPLLAACGAAPEPAPEPTVALDARGGFIVGGLPAHLAWPRGTRVAVRGDGAAHLALMVVTAVRGGTVALAPVAERPNTSVAGRPVARLAEGERPQLGKYHATLTAREGRRVRLSRGAADGVAVGDRYVVSDAAGAPVGRVEVDVVEALTPTRAARSDGR